MKINPVLLHGYYHYMTTLSRTAMIGEHKCTWHKSLMIMTKKAFYSLDALNKAVMKQTESGVNLAIDIKMMMEEEGTKEADGGTVIDSYELLLWIKQECNNTLLEI